MSHEPEPTHRGAADHEPTDHEQLQLSAGAYVLGALSPADREAFSRHLGTCRPCRSSVDQLAGLPGLLSRVPAAEVVAMTTSEDDDVPPLPPALFADLLRRTRRSRRRRRWASAAAGLAAAAVLLATGIAVGRPSTPPVAAHRSMTSVAPASLSATVGLNPVAWGTRIELECRYDDPVRGAVPYTLVVVDASGRSESVGTWTAVPGQVARMSAPTSVPRSQIAEVEVRTASGRPVLTLAGPAAAGPEDSGAEYR
jgi:hypothetical protein